MELMPSMDVEGGRVVKRVRGVRGTGLVVGDPSSVARALASAGARWVHVVDLDGAEAGRPANLGVVGILKDIGLMVQYGGGLRSVEAASEALSAGADRVVVSSAWIRDPSFLDELSSRLGAHRVIAAVEEAGGRLVYDGWRRGSGLALEEALRMLEGRSVAGYLYTQVDVEGTMAGPDLARLKALRSATKRLLIYSGGISSYMDIESLCRAGADGAVVGMAIYSGALDLGRALEVARRC